MRSVTPPEGGVDPFTPFTPRYITGNPAHRLAARARNEAEQAGHVRTANGREADPAAQQHRQRLLAARHVLKQAFGRAAPRVGEPIDERGQVAVEQDPDPQLRAQQQRPVSSRNTASSAPGAAPVCASRPSPTSSSRYTQGV